MATVGTETGELVVRLSLWERLGALHGDVRVPVGTVRAISVVADPWRRLRGVRAPGTGVPRLIMLGTCRGSFGKDFAAVYGNRPAIEVSLRNAAYERLLVSTSHPDRLAATLRDTTGATP